MDDQFCKYDPACYPACHTESCTRAALREAGIHPGEPFAQLRELKAENAKLKAGLLEIVEKSEAYTRKLRAVADAARKVGMNWKVGAPHGLDALDEALAALDAPEQCNHEWRESWTTPTGHRCFRCGLDKQGIP